MFIAQLGTALEYLAITRTRTRKIQVDIALFTGTWYSD